MRRMFFGLKGNTERERGWVFAWIGGERGRLKKGVNNKIVDKKKAMKDEKSLLLKKINCVSMYEHLNRFKT